MVDDQTRWRAADLRDMARRLRTVSDCLSATGRDRQLFVGHAADMDNEAQALEEQVTADRRRGGNGCSTRRLPLASDMLVDHRLSQPTCGVFQPMKDAIKLRTDATRKRAIAADVRRFSASLSNAQDAVLFARHASDLEAEADALEERADAIPGEISSEKAARRRAR
jgi:hypothetical protein